MPDERIRPAPEPGQGGPQPEHHPDHPDIAGSPVRREPPMHEEAPLFIEEPEPFPMPLDPGEPVEGFDRGGFGFDPGVAFEEPGVEFADPGVAFEDPGEGLSPSFPPARSPEAVFAFFAAHDGLGEPNGRNANWITHACHFDGSAWCIMAASLAYLAAGFNPSGKVLEFGTPSRPPSWAASVPDMKDIGFGTTYRWGSAYVWAVANAAAATGRWVSEVDDGRPGDWMMINLNGRGRARDVNSHGCVAIKQNADRSWLSWNGNWGDRVVKATFSPSQIEGFARPAFNTTLEDDLSSAAEDIKRHLDATMRNVQSRIDQHIDDVTRDLLVAIRAVGNGEADANAIVDDITERLESRAAARRIQPID